jgi:hypothetical protein
LPAQLAFFASHLAMIFFVIEACKVKNAMQRKNLYFIREAVAKALRILPRDVQGDRQLARETLVPAVRRG